MICTLSVVVRSRVMFGSLLTLRNNGLRRRRGWFSNSGLFAVGIEAVGGEGHNSS